MKFQPEARHQDTKLFYSVFGLFFIVGIIILIFKSATLFIPGLALTGLPALLLFMIWKSNSGYNTHYELLGDHLYFKRFSYSKIIPYREIEKIEILNEQAATSLIQEKIEEDKRQNLTLTHDATNELIQFVSVPVIFKSTKSRGIVLSRTATLKGDFILLKTVDGQEYLITPTPMKEFITVVQQRIKS